jgi:hypothetical protein
MPKDLQPYPWGAYFESMIQPLSGAPGKVTAQIVSEQSPVPQGDPAAVVRRTNTAARDGRPGERG